MVTLKDMRGIFAALLLLIGVEGYVAWVLVTGMVSSEMPESAPAVAQQTEVEGASIARGAAPGYVLGVPVANPVLMIHVPEQSVFAPEDTDGV